jgi:hypothetical protein
MPPSAHAPLARGLKAFVDAGAGLEQVSATVG